MNEKVKYILSLIDAYELAAAFAAIDQLGVEDFAYSKLKKEFIAGISKTDVDFVDRLTVYVNNILGEKFAIMRYNIPIRPNYFIGREKKLQEIHDFFTQNDTNNIIEEIETLITQGKLKGAISKFLTLVANHDLYNSVALISAQFHSNENDRTDSLITDDTYRLAKAKIVRALLHYTSGAS